MDLVVAVPLVRSKMIDWLIDWLIGTETLQSVLHSAARLIMRKRFQQLRLVVLQHGISNTVVPECYKDDVESRWENLKFYPPPPENAWTDGYQKWQGWLLRGYLPPDKIALRSN